MADRFICAIYCEWTEGNAPIQDMIDRLIDADLDKEDGRITLEQAGGCVCAA